MARTKQMIGGLTIDETTERIYEIANKYGYESRTDRNIENGQGKNWPEMEPDDFAWLVHVLIPRHGSAKVKIGCGITQIVFGKNSRFTFRNAKRPPCCMYAKRSDGSITDISWRECLSPSDNRKKVLNALRNAVRPQIKEFRESLDLFWKCQVCGTVSPDSEVDIDHHPKPFGTLVDEWMASTGRSFETIEVCGEHDLQVGDDIVDDLLRNEWTDFHKESTVNGLRPLCRKCHMMIRRK